MTAGISGAVIEGGGEFIDELHEGEPINWGAVAARTVGGGAKGAMFSVPGLGTAKLAAGTVGIAAAENYLHSAAKGDVSAETLGKALANGTIEGVTAGLVDAAAKKVLGAQPHAEPKPKPELQMEPMTESELEATWGGAIDSEWIPNKNKSRYEAGTVTGSESLYSVETMMHGSQGNLGVIPKEIGEKLNGRSFSNFDEFRKALWIEIGNSKYANEFSRGNKILMKKGRAPFSVPEQWSGKTGKYAIHHIMPIHVGGEVYDLNNIIIVTPRMHLDILDRSYHFNK